MPRSKQSQSKHDAEVRRIANGLERRGYTVKADVKGFPQPNTIGGYRPDVVATKGSERKIVEVETPDSVGSTRDQNQQSAFRKAAEKSVNSTFIKKVTKKD